MTIRRDLEKKVGVLRDRLYNLESKPSDPIRDVGIDAIRESLTQVGRQLSQFPPKQENEKHKR